MRIFHTPCVCDKFKGFLVEFVKHEISKSEAVGLGCWCIFRLTYNTHTNKFIHTYVCDIYINVCISESDCIYKFKNALMKALICRIIKQKNAFIIKNEHWLLKMHKITCMCMNVLVFNVIKIVFFNALLIVL